MADSQPCSAAYGIHYVLQSYDAGECALLDKNSLLVTAVVIAYALINI